LEYTNRPVRVRAEPADSNTDGYCHRDSDGDTWTDGHNDADGDTRLDTLTDPDCHANT
jgi:hypothetical protein